MDYIKCLNGIVDLKTGDLIYTTIDKIPETSAKY